MANPYPAEFQDGGGNVRISGKINFTDPANQPGGGLPTGWTADSPSAGDLDTGGGALIASTDDEVLKGLDATGGDNGTKLSITAGQAVDGTAGDVDLNAGSSASGAGGGVFITAGGGGGNAGNPASSSIDILGTGDSGDTGAITIVGGHSTVSGAGTGGISVQDGSATDTQPGGITISAGNAVADQDGGGGGNITVTAGSAAGPGYDGGNVVIGAGAGSDGGNPGSVKLGGSNDRVGFFGSFGTTRQTLARPSGDAVELWDILHLYGLVDAP